VTEKPVISADPPESDILSNEGIASDFRTICNASSTSAAAHIISRSQEWQSHGSPMQQTFGVWK
jgi:hypothetical protein